mmetsp:Transcript_65814/g.176353  ORF Transcript_65814/g.176353 Transcript_65814/m.176353 type:complete len:105 (-) Transcript_65814:346-660(-)
MVGGIPLPREIKHKKMVIESLNADKTDFSHWVALKYEQYNITSVLYMMDMWERIIFNVILACVFFSTIFAMYIYIHTSVPLFFLSIMLFGFIVFLVLLCPLHQY